MGSVGVIGVVVVGGVAGGNTVWGSGSRRRGLALPLLKLSCGLTRTGLVPYSGPPSTPPPGTGQLQQLPDSDSDGASGAPGEEEDDEDEERLHRALLLY